MPVKSLDVYTNIDPVQAFPTPTPLHPGKCDIIYGKSWFSLLLFQASFVISTIPPALLGRISFNPSLPALKNQVKENIIIYKQK